MTRYVRRPRAHWAEDVPLILNSIQVEGAPPKDTGVLDTDGTPLYSLPDEIGFLATRQFTERP